LTNVSVTVDGELLREVVMGRAIEVDPGKHTFRLTGEAKATSKRDVVVRQGEKDRLPDVTLTGRRLAATGRAMR
jgi:hypothetical protein